MWMYPGPSYTDYPSSKELSTAEVDTRIHKVLDLGVNLNSRASPVPLQGMGQYSRPHFGGFHGSIFSLRSQF
jgi:hypothetical protein